MIYLAEGSPDRIISEKELTALVQDTLGKIGRRNKVLLLPPDYSRKYSQAGVITRAAFGYYGERVSDIMPAIGTHMPMTENEISAMFGDLPRGLFRDSRLARRC